MLCQVIHCAGNVCAKIPSAALGSLGDGDYLIQEMQSGDWPYVTGTCIWGESCYSQKKIGKSMMQRWWKSGVWLSFPLAYSLVFLAPPYCNTWNSWRGREGLTPSMLSTGDPAVPISGEWKKGNNITYSECRRTTEAHQLTLILISLGVSFLISASSRSPNPE